MIVTDEAALRLPCEPVRTRSEGRAVVRRLLAELDAYNRGAARAGRPQGVGLAAPQIGIRRRVAVVTLGGPLALVNPAITGHSPVKVAWEEGCLSLPKRTFFTYRWPWVEVATEGAPAPLRVGAENPADWWVPGLVARSACVQHETAHLFGLLAPDFAAEDYPEFDRWEAWSSELRGHSSRSPCSPSTSTPCGGTPSGAGAR